MNKQKKALRIEQEEKLIQMNWRVIKSYWHIRTNETPKRCILRAIAGIKASKEEIKKLSK